MKFRFAATLAIFSCLIGHACVAMAFESVRTQEISECRSGEIATWNDGKDRPAIGAELVFAYNPTNAPSRFPESVVAQMVSKAAMAWSQCGVPSKLLHRTEAASAAPGVIWVRWDEVESRGNFGLANLGQRTISLSTKAFDLLNSMNPGHDARETLQMTISHEMGHVFGLLAHSRRCVDVLSYYHDGKGQKCYKRYPQDTVRVTEYRHTLPTACDIERCRKANGK
ncbi:MAG: hypothetical protein M0Q22_10935 [Sulfuritalea sp.]|jgi:hypothetical protein|nr:hypothetical protein [Sulfuritalea sp.]